MNYEEARIDALNKKIVQLENKIAYLEANIEVLNINFNHGDYENE